MKRDGDLFKKDFTQSPNYRKWQRQMRQRSKEDKRKARWEKFWNILGGTILIIIGWILAIIFLSM